MNSLPQATGFYWELPFTLKTWLVSNWKLLFTFLRRFMHSLSPLQMKCSLLCWLCRVQCLVTDTLLWPCHLLLYFCLFFYWSNEIGISSVEKNILDLGPANISSGKCEMQEGPFPITENAVSRTLRAIRAISQDSRDKVQLRRKIWETQILYIY